MTQKMKGFYETETMYEGQWEVIQLMVDDKWWTATSSMGTIPGVLQLLVGEIRRLRQLTK